MKTTTVILSAIVPSIAAHGHMVIPPSRNGGAVNKGGDCKNGACLWFSNNVEIPGNVTLPDQFRSINKKAVGGSEQDVYKTSPWRAPGTAKVFGSGCGAAGGGPVMYANGGIVPKGSGIKQGMDALELPEVNSTSTSWTRGGTAEVAWGISANHNGGYSYRLCPKTEEPSEECFQKHQLNFAGESSWIVYTDNSRSAPFNRTTVTEGVYPAGSQWARDPVPGCIGCDVYEKCGYWTEDPIPGKGPNPWNDWVNCNAGCNGAAISKKDGSCPAGTLQFPEPLPGISGLGKIIWQWSVLDLVEVPSDLPAGDYLLSWRWDCEESTQVWENCADITLA